MEQAFIGASVQYRETMEALRGVERREFPFAYAKTLTQVAQLGQLAVRARMRWLYNLHTDWLPKGILVKPSRKEDIRRYGLAEAWVYSSAASTPYIGLHESGGMKEPKRGRTVINVPSITLERRGYQTQSGAVQLRWKPSTLLQHYNAQRRGTGKSKRGTGAAKPFLIAERGGQPAIVAKRRGASSVGVEVLWLFVKQARIRPTLKAEETVYREVKGNMERLLNVNLRAASNI